MHWRVRKFGDLPRVAHLLIEHELAGAVRRDDNVLVTDMRHHLSAGSCQSRSLAAESTIDVHSHGANSPAFIDGED